MERVDVHRSISGSKDSRTGRGLDGRAPAGSTATVPVVMQSTSGREECGHKDEPSEPDEKFDTARGRRERRMLPSRKSLSAGRCCAIVVGGVTSRPTGTLTAASTTHGAWGDRSPRARDVSAGSVAP
jgi:hypothetical protein